MRSITHADFARLAINAPELQAELVRLEHDERDNDSLQPWIDFVELRLGPIFRRRFYPEPVEWTMSERMKAASVLFRFYTTDLDYQERGQQW